MNNLTETRKYKCVAMVRPTLSSDKVMELVDSMFTTLTESESIDSKNSTMQTFAYPMDRNKQGHMITMDLSVKPSSIQVIRRKMEIDENFLRVMFIKEDKKYLRKNKNNLFQIKDEFFKSMSSSVTKRGKINFTKNLKRFDKSFISNSVKRLRFLGILPYCNYDV